MNRGFACPFLLAVASMLFVVCSVPMQVTAADNNNRGMGALFIMGTIGGSSYTPKYSDVFDSKPSSSQFVAVPQETGFSLKEFDGFGLAIDMIGVVGGSFFIELDLAVQYRNDNESNNTGSNQDFFAPYVYNRVGSIAVDIGHSGGSANSHFGWYVSIGCGFATNSTNGQYPAFANLSTSSTVVLADGRTELYYSDTQYDFYFGQIRLGGEIKKEATIDSPRLALGLRWIYSQEIQVAKENVPDFEFNFPTGPTVTVTNGVPGVAGRPLTVADVKPPLTSRGRYYIQGVTFRSLIAELGLKTSF